MPEKAIFLETQLICYAPKTQDIYPFRPKW